MTRFTERLTAAFAWPVDHGRSTAVILGAIVIFIGLTLPKGRVDFSLEQLYPQDSPLASIYKEHKAAYGADDNSFFVAREGDPWSPHLRDAEERIAALPQVESTISPFTMERLEDRDGLLSMRPLSPSDTDPMARGTVVGTRGEGGAVIVRIAEQSNNHDGREILISEVEAIIAELDGEWHLAGMPVIRTAYVRLVIKDMSTLIPLSVLVAGFFFVLSFRDTRQVVLGLSSITLGMLTAGAAYIVAGGVVNTFSPAFFSVVVVVGTSDLIHLVHRFSDYVDANPDAEDATRVAARKAAEEIGFACLLTTTTTAVGFLALMWTDLPTVQMFGLGAGLGVILTYLTTFLLVPPILARMRPPSRSARGHATGGSDRMTRLGQWAMARRRSMLGAFAVLAVILAVFGAQTKVAYRLLADLGGTSAGTGQAFMEENMGAVLPMSVDIRFEDDAREPKNLRAIGELTDWLRDQPLVGHATSLTDLTQLSWRTLSGSSSELPPNREAAAQSLFALGMGSEDPVPHVMIEDGSRTRVMLRVHDEGGDATTALARALEDKAKAVFSPLGAEITITGVAYIIQWINNTLTRQFVGSFGLALAFIGLAWALTTRSVRRVVMALIPNILPLLAVLGALGLTGVPLKPTTAMVFSIGLGIAVDDTIHFLAAYERWRKNNPECTSEEAALHAYQTAGRSMLDTSIVLMAGMLVMCVSEFNAFLYLGAFTAWAIFAALITDLFLLGPLLVALDDR